MDFTKALQELEQINQWFQQEQINLDEGLKQVKRGKELIALCRERLAKVENEFVQITTETGTPEQAVFGSSPEVTYPSTTPETDNESQPLSDDEASELDEILAQTSAEIQAKPVASSPAGDQDAPDPEDDIPF